MEKREIALRQIKAAARHYKNGDYVCSITLSSAAEEILGKILKNKIGFNQLDCEISYLKTICRYFGKEITDKDLINSINKLKNELKHNDSGENKYVKADFKNEAVSFFIKSVKNYYDCYNEFPDDKIVRDLFEFLTL